MKMMYLDGGVYLNNQTVQAIVATIGISAASSIGDITTAIKFFSDVVAANLSTVPGGAVIAFLFKTT